MQKKRLNKALSWLLCTVLIVAMALITTGCSDNASNSKKTQSTSETSKDAGEAASATEVTVLGEGSNTFDFAVVDLDGVETRFEIHTDEETVGAALIALNLIEGDEGPYGLYVKSVNGIQADYDKDKVYWAFYVNDEYGTSGVDLTEIVETDIYSFRMAK